MLSGLSATATPRATDEEADAAEGDGNWDMALRGLRLSVGKRVFVDEGTKGGVSGRRAAPFFAVISSHCPGCCYEVKPFEARQHERAVPAHALSNSKSILADTAPRSRGQMTSQQKKVKVQDRRDRVRSLRGRPEVCGGGHPRIPSAAAGRLEGVRGSNE